MEQGKGRRLAESGKYRKAIMESLGLGEGLLSGERGEWGK